MLEPRKRDAIDLHAQRHIALIRSSTSLLVQTRLEQILCFKFRFLASSDFSFSTHEIKEDEVRIRVIL